MTANLKHRSPVKLGGRPVKTVLRDGWPIVRQYAGESSGPFIIDLSHFPRWDIQDKNPGHIRPYGDKIPEMPGQILMDTNFLMGRLNATQAIAWHFSPEPPLFPQNTAFTDVTESAAAIALAGPSVFMIAEKLCSLDLLSPRATPPFLVQGPFSNVPCHIWVLDRDGFGGCFALTCSRGYAHDMVGAVLEAGSQWEMLPDGEDRFHSWLGW